VLAVGNFVVAFKVDC